MSDIRTHFILNKLTLKDGDIIFQTSQSKQSAAISIATNSKITHCGIIYKINNQYFVYEAVQPVKYTPIIKWLRRGKNGYFAIKRVINSEHILTENVLNKMKYEGQKFLGKNYDLTFEWSDDKIYCSELIWKIYKRGAGIELGTLQELKDFNINDERVQKIMQNRYGSKIPFNDTVISPKSIYLSPLLETIYSNLQTE